jgi:hypothetical protein
MKKSMEEDRIVKMVHKITIELNNHFVTSFKERVSNFDDDQKVRIILSSLSSFLAYQLVFIDRSRVDYMSGNTEEFLMNLHEEMKQNSLKVATELAKTIFLPEMDTLN